MALKEATMGDLPTVFEEPLLIDTTCSKEDKHLVAEKKNHALQNNTTAMASCALAFEDATHHGMIIKSITPAYSRGIA